MCACFRSRCDILKPVLSQYVVVIATTDVDAGAGAGADADAGVDRVYNSPWFAFVFCLAI